MGSRRYNLNFIKFFKKQVKPAGYIRERISGLYDSSNVWGADQEKTRKYMERVQQLDNQNNLPLLQGDSVQATDFDYLFVAPAMPALKVEDFMIDVAAMDAVGKYAYGYADAIEFSAQVEITCNVLILYLNYIKDFLETYKAKHPGVKFPEPVEDFPKIYDLCTDLISRYKGDGRKLADTKLDYLESADKYSREHKYGVHEASREDYFNYYSESRRSKKLRALRDYTYGSGMTPYRIYPGPSNQDGYFKYLSAEKGSRELVNFLFVFSSLIQQLGKSIMALSHMIRLASNRKNSGWNNYQGRLYDIWPNHNLGQLIAIVSKFPGANLEIEKIIEDSLSRHKKYNTKRAPAAQSTANKKIIELIKIIDVDLGTINVADTNAPEARPGITKRIKECARTASALAKITPERDDIETIRLALKKADNQTKIDLIIDAIFETIEDCCAIADSFSGLSEPADDSEE